MSSNKYFDISFDNSFEGKCNNPLWNRTVGVERQLCNLLNDSRDSPITYSQVRLITGWQYLMIRRWFAELLSAEVFTDVGVLRTQRWRLTRDFPEDMASLAELIPPVGSTIVSRKQAGNQATSKPQASPSIDIISNIVDEDYGLPGIDGDDSDDFFSVFSRI
jgi:hypothetical protein